MTDKILEALELRRQQFLSGEKHWVAGEPYLVEDVRASCLFFDAYQSGNGLWWMNKSFNPGLTLWASRHGVDIGWNDVQTSVGDIIAKLDELIILRKEELAATPNQQ